MHFVPLIPLSELPENSHRTIKAGELELSLFHYEGVVTALGYACLHMGGDLGQGRVQRLDDGELYAVCPWHGWQYNLRNRPAVGARFRRFGVRRLDPDDPHPRPRFPALRRVLQQA